MVADCDLNFGIYGQENIGSRAKPNQTKPFARLHRLLFLNPAYDPSRNQPCNLFDHYLMPTRID